MKGPCLEAAFARKFMLIKKFNLLGVVYIQVPNVHNKERFTY